MTRSNYVEWRSPERQPSARLRDASPTYRVAVEALNIAADLGCDGAIYDALWGLCEREAKAAEANMGAMA